MSLHKSFAAKRGTGRHRNVLSRAERVSRLLEEERFKEGDPVFGLPKVRSIKPKKKAKAAAKEGAGETAPAAGGAEAAKPAAEAAKPAAGAEKAKGKSPAPAEKGKPAGGEKK